MKCYGCSGLNYIKLLAEPLREISTYKTLDDPDISAVEHKIFPCPMCQPVFYLSDIVQVNAAEVVFESMMTDTSFLAHIRRRLGAVLGMTAQARNLIQEQVPKTFEVLNGTAKGEYKASLNVVRANAAGWLKKTGL